MHSGSPVDVMPIRYSTPPICANAGPPESPKHVCDGAGTNENWLAENLSMRLAPQRLRGGAPSSIEVRPNPTRRIALPSNDASKGLAHTGTGSIAGLIASTTTPRSLACVAAS